MSEFNQNGSPSNGRYRGEYMGDSNVPLSANAPFPEVRDEVDFRQIIGLLLHNKWLIAGFTALTTVFAVIYAYQVMPIYSSNGTVLITTSGNRYSMAGSDLDALLISNFGVGMGSSLQNELLILRSRTFLTEIATRIHNERYLPNGQMYPLLWAEYPVDSTLVPVEMVFGRIAAVLQFLPMGRENNGMSIVFESPSPDEAARVVDLAITSYADVSTRLNRQQARSALNFLETEITKVQTNLGDAEQNLRNLMSTTGLVQLDQQATEQIRQYSQLEGEKRGIQVKQVAIQSAIDSYTRELEKLKPGLAGQITSAISFKLNRLQYALAEVETQRILVFTRNSGATNLTADPQVIALDEQISALKQEINMISSDMMSEENGFIGAVGPTDGGIISRINTYRNNLIQLEIENRQIETQVQIIDHRLQEFNTFIDNLPENIIDLARARRDLQINEQLYITISRQFAEMQLWEQTQSGVARVVDYGSKSKKPIKPRKTLILIIGFALGLMLSVGFVVVREIATYEINSIEKLRKKGLPLLAVIPDMSSYIKENFDGRESVRVRGAQIDTGLVMVLDSISPIAESFRRLQANVIYSQPDNTFKSLIVTSANKSEGKTTLSTNLAVALAESGKSVCIIDCDFRRPRVHNVFGSNLQPGVIEVLFEGKSWKDVMQTTMIPNVKVLSGGKRPPNPAEIIRSHKLHDLINELKENFDHVLIDSAPYGIISDAAPLVKLADGVILAVRFNQTREPELDLTLENLQKVKANVLGVVMTAFDHKKSSGYYYTSYYYKYAYDSYYAYHEKTT